MLEFNIDDLTAVNLTAFSNVSAAMPPPGVQSNFVNPENQNVVYYAVTSPLFGIMTILLVNRLFVKRYKIQKFSWDDRSLP